MEFDNNKLIEDLTQQLGATIGGTVVTESDCDSRNVTVLLNMNNILSRNEHLIKGDIDHYSVMSYHNVDSPANRTEDYVGK